MNFPENTVYWDTHILEWLTEILDLALQQLFVLYSPSGFQNPHYR